MKDRKSFIDCGVLGVRGNFRFHAVSTDPNKTVDWTTVTPAAAILAFGRTSDDSSRLLRRLIKEAQRWGCLPRGYDPFNQDGAVFSADVPKLVEVFGHDGTLLKAVDEWLK